MKISNYLFILLNCLFSLTALPAKAAIATHQTRHQTQQLTIKKEKKSFFSKMKPATTDNGNKERFYAILGFAGAIICAVQLSGVSGELAVLSQFLWGILGIACLASGIIGLAIFLYKRKRAMRTQQ